MNCRVKSKRHTKQSKGINEKDVNKIPEIQAIVNIRTDVEVFLKKIQGSTETDVKGCNVVQDSKVCSKLQDIEVDVLEHYQKMVQAIEENVAAFRKYLVNQSRVYNRVMQRCNIDEDSSNLNVRTIAEDYSPSLKKLNINSDPFCSDAEDDITSDKKRNFRKGHHKSFTSLCHHDQKSNHSKIDPFSSDNEDDNINTSSSRTDSKNLSKSLTNLSKLDQRSPKRFDEKDMFKLILKNVTENDRGDYITVFSILSHLTDLPLSDIRIRRLGQPGPILVIFKSNEYNEIFINKHKLRNTTFSNVWIEQFIPKPMKYPPKTIVPYHYTTYINKEF